MRDLEGRLAESAVAELRDRFLGALVLPGDPEYDAARVVWNGMIDRYPALVARCTGSDDVISALRFARDHDWSWLYAEVATAWVASLRATVAS